MVEVVPSEHTFCVPLVLCLHASPNTDADAAANSAVTLILCVGMSVRRVSVHLERLRVTYAPFSSLALAVVAGGCGCSIGNGVRAECWRRAACHNHFCFSGWPRKG